MTDVSPSSQHPPLPDTQRQAPLKQVPDSARFGLARSVCDASSFAETQLPRLQALLLDRAADRGKRRALCADMAESKNSDQDFFRLIRAASNRLPQEERETLGAGLRRSYDQARIAEFGRRIESSALQLGLQQGRTLDLAGVELARKELHQQCNSHRHAHTDLYLRYPSLGRRVDEVCAEREQLGLEMRQHAEKEAITLSVALRRFFPHFKDAFALLRDRTELERTLVDDAFVQRYGKSILQEFEDVCTRPGFSLVYPTERISQRAKNLMRGDHAAAAADALVAAVQQKGFRRYERIRDALREIAPEHMSVVAAQFEQSASSAQPSFRDLSKEFKHPNNAIIAALLRGDSVLAHTIELKTLLNDKKGGAVAACEQLEAVPVGQLAALVARFDCTSTNSLYQTITQLTGASRALKQRMFSYLEWQNAGRHHTDFWGPEARSIPAERRYLVAGVRCAVERLGSTTVGEWFDGEDAFTRRAMVADYHLIYGSRLDQDLQQNFRRRTRLLSETLIREGHLPDEEAIYQCVDGIGTDVLGIKAVLKHKRVSEIAALDMHFRSIMRERHGKEQSLAERLERETSGDDLHDMRMLLQGWPESAAGWVERVESTHRHERSGWFRRLDLITREGPVMDRDVRALREYYLKETKNGELSKEAAKRIEIMSRMCLRDMTIFRKTKNAMADVVANLSGGVASGITLLAAAQAGIQIHSHFWSVGLLVFGTSAIVRYSIKKSLKGYGYSTEEVLQDLAFGTVDGMAPMLAKFSPSQVLKQGLNLGAKIGGKTAVGRIGKSFLQQRLLLRPLVEGGLNQALDLSDGPKSEDRSACVLENGATNSGPDVCSTATSDMAFERALARLMKA